MSAILIVAVVAGMLVLGLLALGAGLLVALRSTGEAVVALERRLAEVEDHSTRVRDALSSVDSDLTAMTAQLTHDRGSISEGTSGTDVEDASHAPAFGAASANTGPEDDTDLTSDTPMQGRTA